MDYKSSGVDINKSEKLVSWLQSTSSNKNHKDKIIQGIGGFASIFRFDFPQIKDPCLVGATDGVGTKLKLAIELGDYRGLGQDLVAMCVNDLICTGARPLFFLDYLSTSSLDLKQAQGFLQSLQGACERAGMALLGGETAEMPGLYQPGDFDCAGFALGVVDRGQVCGSHLVKESMEVIGVSSSGFHSNGFSLLRSIYRSSQDRASFGKELLEPTHIYVDLVARVLEKIDVAAMAHITGGGIQNIPRILPSGLGLFVKMWDWPQLFIQTMERGELSQRQMLDTFNCGVGFCFVVHSRSIGLLKEMISSAGFYSVDMGVVEKSKDPLVFPRGV